MLTETRLGLVHTENVLAPDGTPVGRFEEDERKVAIWSRWGWRNPEPAPVGVLADRWVAATTDTPDGPLRVVGLCIPYRFLWVRYRPPEYAKRRVWEEHLQFLEAIEPHVSNPAAPQLVAGDFNQRVPPTPRLDPLHAVTARERALAGHEVATVGRHGSDGKGLLCHLAIGHGSVASVEVVERHAEGRDLSDHHGAIVTLDTVARSHATS